MSEDSKIEVKTLFSMVNAKRKGWFDQLNPAQQKKFGAWLYQRYMSSSNSRSADLQRYYILATNQHINKNFNILSKHPKLAYLLFTTIPFPSGESFHPYIKPLKRTKSEGTELLKLLAKLYPDEKMDNLETMIRLTSEDDMRELLESHGLTDKEIKKAL